MTAECVIDDAGSGDEDMVYIGCTVVVLCL